jgi:hypothetical protein
VFDQIREITSTDAALDHKIGEIVGVLKNYPLEYVMWNFPWLNNADIQQVKLLEPYASRFGVEYGPDVWACEFLDDLGDKIRARKFDGKKATLPIRFSTSSGHGIGKSTTTSWLIMFIQDCYQWAMGVVTANTSDQLRTKTWAELSKWHRLAITGHLWEYTNSRGNMALVRKGDRSVGAKWRCDAMTARAENAEAFQGLHAANSVPYYIFDEASGIEQEIWQARYGGATDGMPMSFDWGNPTRKSGEFYENTVGDNKHRFITRCIDSRTVQITNKDLIEEWRQDWGEDSDLFKVKVRGVFPSAGSVQFISSDLVSDAMRRPASHSKADPLIIGVDVARFGVNDTIIFPRIGMDARSFPYKRYNGLDAYAVADKVIEVINEFAALGKPVAGLFVDGGGLGAGPVDILRRLGWNPIDVNFGKGSSDSRFRYWGDQMWGQLRDALDRLALPFDEDLRKELTVREYGLTPTGKINLESKKIMQERGVPSPDIADALALTFAQQTAPVDALRGYNMRPVDSDFNPFDEKAWAR